MVSVMGAGWDSFHAWKSLQNPFLGSSNRKLFGLWNTSDAIQLAYPKENIPFVRTNNGIQVDSTV